MLAQDFLKEYLRLLMNEPEIASSVRSLWLELQNRQSNPELSSKMRNRITHMLNAVPELAGTWEKQQKVLRIADVIAPAAPKVPKVIVKQEFIMRSIPVQITVSVAG